MAVLATHLCPNDARRVDYSSVNVRTRNVTQKPHRELHDAHGHRFVFGMSAAHDDQHAAHLRGRVDEDRECENGDEDVELCVASPVIAEATGCCCLFCV